MQEAGTGLHVNNHRTGRELWQSDTARPAGTVWHSPLPRASVGTAARRPHKMVSSEQPAAHDSSGGVAQCFFLRFF